MIQMRNQLSNRNNQLSNPKVEVGTKNAIVLTNHHEARDQC